MPISVYVLYLILPVSLYSLYHPRLFVFLPRCRPTCFLAIHPSTTSLPVLAPSSLIVTALHPQHRIHSIIHSSPSSRLAVHISMFLYWHSYIVPLFLFPLSFFHLHPCVARILPFLRTLLPYPPPSPVSFPFPVLSSISISLIFACRRVVNLHLGSSILYLSWYTYTISSLISITITPQISEIGSRIQFLLVLPNV